MKHLVLLMLFFIGANLYAQNPDGKFASVHITPSWLWGNTTYNGTTGIWYPPTQASDPQIVESPSYGTIITPLSFGMNTTIKIPTTSFLTLSLSYAFSQNFEKFTDPNQGSKYYYHSWNTNGNIHMVSFTASVYNLFSLYIE